MLTLYFAPTPNGQKISIMLEECGLQYETVLVNILAGDQFKPEFLEISPNNKIPALVDSDGPDGEPISIFESGAILQYLADKTGRFLPADYRQRIIVLQWLMFQKASVGPMFGQNHHFNDYAPEKIPYAQNRYIKETARLYGVMDRQLAKSEYIALDEYTIADMAIFPWVANYKRHGVDMPSYPNLRRWMDTLKERPALRAGMAHMIETRWKTMSADDKKTLFDIDKK